MKLLRTSTFARTLAVCAPTAAAGALASLMGESRLAVKTHRARQWFSGAVVLAVAALIALPHPAGAAGVPINQSHDARELTASADFSSTDGCIETFAGVLASDIGPGSSDFGGDSGSIVNFFEARVDTCNNDALLEVLNNRVPIPDSDFQIADDLSSASLNTTVAVQDDISGDTFNLAMHLDWTATGASTHVHHAIPATPNQDRVTFVGGAVGTERSAQAVGSINDGTTEFAPGPSDEAHLFSGEERGKIIILGPGRTCCGSEPPAV